MSEKKERVDSDWEAIFYNYGVQTELDIDLLLEENRIQKEKLNRIELIETQLLAKYEEAINNLYSERRKKFNWRNLFAKNT